MQATFENPNLAVGVDSFVESIKDKRPLQSDTFEAARAFIANIQAGQTFKEDVSRNDFDVPVSSEGYIPVRIIRRIDSGDKAPLIFYVHGGGWIMGNAMTYDRLLRKLAKNSYAAVAFPEYTLVPTGRFPTQLEELWSALSHIIKNAETYQVNPNKIVIMGDGTGAAMAAVLTNYAQKHGVMADYQLLLYPSLDANLNMDSYRLFDRGPWITKATYEWFWENYLSDINLRNQAMVSPLLIPDKELKGLPETLIITAENDPTRDDGEIYARKLSSVGVNAVSVRMNGTIHDFLMLEPLAHTTPTRLAFRLISSTLKQVLWGDENYNGPNSFEEEK